MFICRMAKGRNGDAKERKLYESCIKAYSSSSIFLFGFLRFRLLSLYTVQFMHNRGLFLFSVEEKVGQRKSKKGEYLNNVRTYVLATLLVY